MANQQEIESIPPEVGESMKKKSKLIVQDYSNKDATLLETEATTFQRI